MSGTASKTVAFQNAGTLRSTLSFFVAIILGAQACSHSQVNWTPAPSQNLRELRGVNRTESVAFFPQDDLSSRASEDGRYVAFVSAETGNLDVWVRDYRFDSTYPVSSHPSDDYDPAISPDAKYLAYVSRRADAKGDLYLCGLDGSKPKKLTNESTADRQPVFAPDGKRLYYTSADPAGLEFISMLELEGVRGGQRISPTPGFDATIDSTGAYLVYTAPRGTGGRRYPHLVALRLTDNATIAVTPDDAPAGFASLGLKGKSDGYLYYVRFPDDDTGDGIIDGQDKASLWRLEIDFEDLFTNRELSQRPVPLSDGSRDELFPNAVGNWLYHTVTVGIQQDVVRLPIEGLFPNYANPEDYLRLGQLLEDKREKWFAFRNVVARTSETSLLHANALHRIAELQQQRQRPDLALRVWKRLAKVTEESSPESPRDELHALALLELSTLNRLNTLQSNPGMLGRERAARHSRMLIEGIRTRYKWSNRVLARIELENAEILLSLGKKADALAVLDLLAKNKHKEAPIAVRAMVRRAELFESISEPEVLGRVYSEIIRKFPEQKRWNEIAANRIIEAYRVNARSFGGWRKELEAIRRVVSRTDVPAVRLAGRRSLAQLLIENGQQDYALEELKSLVSESVLLEAWSAGYKGLKLISELHEGSGRFDEAIATWLRIEKDFSAIPQAITSARESRTRLNLKKAEREELKGNKRGALDAYKAAIEVDFTQVRALRRYIAISAGLGRSEEVLKEFSNMASKSPRTPMARYARALSLTWMNPPRLEAARKEIEEAIELNPQFIFAYITRGWILEMLELTNPTSDFLEQAIADYTVANRLNNDSGDAITESEINLNLSNARFRLGVRANDMGNIDIAFRLYLDRMRSNESFENAAAELVFWERLGRSAAWKKEWAISVMAVKEALRISEQKGLKSRRPQLFGNLGLSYAQAEEYELASQAFRSFRIELAKQENAACEGITNRNRAVQQLELARRLGFDDLDEAFMELKNSRALLEQGEGCRPPVPSLVTAPLDSTRAPYGFDQRSELDLNLAWTELGHELRGDVSVVNDIRTLREQVLTEVLDSPKILTIDMRKELLGLLGHNYRRSCRASNIIECVAHGETLYAHVTSSRFEQGVGDESVQGRAMLYLRARILALLTEELSTLKHSEEEALLALQGKLTKQLRKSQTAFVSLLRRLALQEEEGEVSELQRAIKAFIQSSYNEELQTPLSEQEPILFADTDLFELPGVLARVYFALGLDAWRVAQLGEISGENFEGIFRSLTATDKSLHEFRKNFRMARAWSKLGISKLALNVRVRSRKGLGLTEETRTDTATTTVGRIAQLGQVFETRRLPPTGNLDETFVDSSELSDWADEQMPAELDLPWETLAHAMIRTATSATNNDANSDLLHRLDRMLLLRMSLNKPVVGLNAYERTDRREAKALAVSLQRLRDLYRTWDVQRDKAVSQKKFREFKEAEKKLSRAISRVRGSAISVRDLGRPFDSDEVLSALSKEEALVVPFEYAGQLRLLLVDGSTQSESAFQVFKTELPIDELRSDVLEFRRALAQNEKNASEKGLQVWDHLLKPLGRRLDEINTLIICDRFIGGPVPRAMSPWLGKRALVHASAPSSFLVSRERRIFGVKRRVKVVDGELGRELAKNEILAESLGSVKRRKKELLGPVSKRTSIERLVDVPSAVVLFESKVYLDDTIPERSVFYQPPRKGLGNVFGLRDELNKLGEKSNNTYLDEIRLPGRVWVLNRAKGVDHRLLDGYDLAVAMAGTPSLVIIPEEFPEKARKRILEDFLGSLSGFSAAQALGNAIHAELGRTPAAGLITFLGEPGLSPKKEIKIARKGIKKTERRVLKALRRGDRAQVIEEMEHLRRLQRVSRKSGQLKPKRTFEILVQYLRQEKRWARAVDVQREFIEYNINANRKLDAARAWVVLAELYSANSDFKSALSTYEKVIAELKTLKDDIGLAQALNSLGMHYRRELRYEKAAQAFESAAKIHARKGLLNSSDKRLVNWAKENLRRLGSVYMNQLADSSKARSVYRRWLKVSKTPAGRLEPTLGLARVARREGDFRAALALATQAREVAQEVGDRLRELEAIVEGANVAWYQGDYVIGRELCQLSLKVADENIANEKQRKRPNLRRHIKGKIYSLSVCGLVNMSTNNFEAARGNLLLAAELARSSGLPTELATQFNNLGRVYLEFGQYKEAIKTFRKALAIDQRLADKFGLAYDLRNLGAGLAQQGSSQAEQTLSNALNLAKEVKDKNNELRTLFELGEFYRKRGQVRDSKAAYEQAEVIARTRRVKELSWKIHRAVGLLKLAEDDRIGAEEELIKAVAIVEKMSTRSGNSDYGVSPYAAFDDLMILLIEQDRLEEAFTFMERGRVLSQMDVLADRRIKYFDERVGSGMEMFRESSTATASAAGLELLRGVAPSIAAAMTVSDAEALSAELDSNQAIVLYRLTYKGLIIFVLDEDGLQSAFVEVEGRKIRKLIREYGVQMTNLAELDSVNSELSKIMIEPIRERISNKSELAVVLSGLLRYVALPALNFDEKTTLLDKFVTLQALAPQQAVAALSSLKTPISLDNLRGFVSTKENRRLPFAEKELELIQEIFPQMLQPKVGKESKASFVEALSDSDAVVHFAGHFELAGRDSLASEIRFEDGQIRLYDFLAEKGNAELVVLSACESRIGDGENTITDKSTGKELLSLTETLMLSGARSVLASVSRVNDVAAAVLMKRFYRALRKHPPAIALRKARQVVRKFHPHPAWWANFTFVSGQRYSPLEPETVSP